MSACDCNTCRCASERGGPLEREGRACGGGEPPFFSCTFHPEGPSVVVKLWPGALRSGLFGLLRSLFPSNGPKGGDVAAAVAALPLPQLPPLQTSLTCRRRRAAFSRAAHVVQRTHAQRHTDTHTDTDTLSRRRRERYQILSARYEELGPIVVPLAPMAA